MVPYLNKAGLENQSLAIRSLWFKMTLVGHTTPSGNAKFYSDTAGVFGYVEGDTLTGEDSDTGFTTLDYNGDPTVVGILVACGDAVELVDVRVPQKTIVGGTGWTSPGGTETSNGVTADITITKEGTGDDGVTTSSNLSFTLSIAQLDLDANISNHTFWVNVVYKASQSVTG